MVKKVKKSGTFFEKKVRILVKTFDKNWIFNKNLDRALIRIFAFLQDILTFKIKDTSSHVSHKDNN